MSTFIDIPYEEMEQNNLAERLADYNIVVIRNVPEVHQYVNQVKALISSNNRGQANKFLDELTVPSAEVLAELVEITDSLRKNRYLSTLFAGFINKLQFQGDCVVDGGITRYYFPKDYADFRKRSDLFSATNFFSYLPHDEAGASIVPNLPVGPHRDVDIFNKDAIPINIWFPLHDLERARSLILFPDVTFEKENFFSAGYK